MLAVTTGSLAKVIVLCTISAMMCCIKPYWNDCSIGLRQYSRTKKRYCIRYRKSVMQSEYGKRRKSSDSVLAEFYKVWHFCTYF